MKTQRIRALHQRRYRILRALAQVNTQLALAEDLPAHVAARRIHHVRGCALRTRYQYRDTRRVSADWTLVDCTACWDRRIAEG